VFFGGSGFIKTTVSMTTKEGDYCNHDNQYSRNMLDLACFKGHHECVESLLLQGATILVQDGQSRRPPPHAAGKYYKKNKKC
jgi:hypothetical protein